MAFSYKNYEESQRVKDWRDRADAAIGRLEQMQPFNYNVNADALYQQYKDQYMRAGRTAMQDTMGQAAAMTGGYGNSYAASAGNQAYQAQLGRLNEAVPQLYSLALEKYNADRQDLYNRANLYGNRYGDEYGRDYGQYGDDWNRAFANYQQAVSEDQFNRTYGLNSYKALYGSGSGSYGGTGEYGVAAGDQETSESDASDSTKLFQSSILTKQEFGRANRDSKGNYTGNYNSYGDYLKNAIAKWQNQGDLTKEQAAYLLNVYADEISAAEQKKKNTATTAKKNTEKNTITRSTK